MAGVRGCTVVGPKSADVVLVGRSLLQDHNDDDAGARSTRSTSSGIASSDGTTGVGSLGAAGVLSPLLTAPRITSSSSFARLLTTGGVDGNACNSAAISAGGCSTSLNTKRLESTYLKKTPINQSLHRLIQERKRLPCTLVLFARNAVPPYVQGAEDLPLDARRAVGAKSRFIPTPR